MSLFFGNTGISEVIYNDTSLDKIYYNNVLVYEKLKIVSWADGTDEEIAAMIAASDQGIINLTDYWSVGDERKVYLSTMNSQTYLPESHTEQEVTHVLVAADTGVQDSSNPCYNYSYVTATSGRTYPSFIVQQKDGFMDLFSRQAELGVMNVSSTNVGGWDACNRRTWCNDVYRNALPSIYKDCFKQVKVKTVNGGDSSATLVESDDYFFLPAECEVASVSTGSRLIEINALSKWPYYLDVQNRFKKKDSSSFGAWWLRTPYKDTSNSFAFITTSSSAGTTHGGSQMEIIIAPAGCI